MSTVAPLLGASSAPPYPRQHRMRCNGSFSLTRASWNDGSIEMTRAWQGLGYTDFAATPPAANLPFTGAARQCASRS